MSLALIPFLTSPSFASVSSAAGGNTLPLPYLVSALGGAATPSRRRLSLPPTLMAAAAWDLLRQGLLMGVPPPKVCSVSLTFRREPMPVSRDVMDPLNSECIKSTKKMGG